MGNRPEGCSRCVFEDCMLNDDIALYCEVSVSPAGEAETLPFFENKAIGISQTLSDNICPNIHGSVEVYDDMFGVRHGVIRARKCGRWDCSVCGNERVKKIRKRLKGSLYYRFGEVQKRGESGGWKYLKFLTLTYYHKFDTPQEAYKVMTVFAKRIAQGICKNQDFSLQIL